MYIDVEYTRKLDIVWFLKFSLRAIQETNILRNRSRSQKIVGLKGPNIKTNMGFILFYLVI